MPHARCLPHAVATYPNGGVMPHARCLPHAVATYPHGGVMSHARYLPHAVATYPNGGVFTEDAWLTPQPRSSLCVTRLTRKTPPFITAGQRVALPRRHHGNQMLLYSLTKRSKYSSISAVDSLGCSWKRLYARASSVRPRWPQRYMMRSVLKLCSLSSVITVLRILCAE